MVSNRFVFIFTPKLGQDEAILTIFQLGWFNHQLVLVVDGCCLLVRLG